MRAMLLCVALLAAWMFAAFAQQPNEGTRGVRGYWQGTLNAGVPLRLTFTITEADGKLSGSMKSLDQGGAKINLSAVSEKDGAALIEVASIRGKFEGKLSADSMEIVGTWSQGLAKLPLTIKRSESEVVLRRPQEPKPPFPYREEEVAIASTAKDVKLAGTFTIPDGEGPHPTVVLVTGSGAQDRDEALLGHRPFLVLADYLARHGIAVLRCDDRGFAKSTGNLMTATTLDLAEDTRAQIAWLRLRKEVDLKRIGIIGHSEGGIIAPMVAAKDPQVSFIVLLAGVGVPMKDLLLRQMEDMMRLEGGDEKKVARSISVGRELLQLLTEDADDATLEKRVRELQESARRELTAEELAKAPPLETAVAMSLARLRSPWQRWVIRYDPAPALREVQCPVLSLNGEKDCQVAAKENSEGIARALAAAGNKNVTAEILPGLNHLFQNSKTGAFKEYGEIEETMAPSVLAKITESILRSAPR